MRYYFGDPGRDTHLDNYPNSTCSKKQAVFTPGPSDPHIKFEQFFVLRALFEQGLGFRVVVRKSLGL